MSGGAGPVAVVLRCPECGSELPGLDADRVWACVPCGRAWEVEDGRLAPRPYRAWRRPVEGSVVWLPFWRVAFRAEVVCRDAAVRDAIERAAASGRAWVRAFRLDGAFQIGDPGQAFTEADHEELLDAELLPEIAGARLRSAEAIRLARLFVLARADLVADVTPAELTLHDVETALVAVPFVHSGRDLVCAVDGKRYRRSAMGDLA